MRAPADPPEGTVRVWQIPLAPAPALLAAASAVLAPEERLRAARARHEDRRRYTVSHGATRMILGSCLDLPPERLRFVRGEWGKPRLADHPELNFNLSHSGDLALLAVTQRRAVGVDVERIRPADRTRPAERYFPPEEAAFVREAVGRDDSAARYALLWTRKEAWAKAAGGRVLRGLHLPVAGPDRQGGAVLEDPKGRFPGRWRLYGLPVAEGYAAALAVAAEWPVRTEVRTWPRKTTPARTGHGS